MEQRSFLQSEVQKEFARRGTLLCLNVPKGTSFGIDYQQFQTGDKFKGIKLIPPGLHFIYYNTNNEYGGEGAPKTSFFKWFEAGEVLVTRWNSETEDLDFVEEEEANRYREGVKNYEFDRNLGAYSEARLKDWKKLSSFISKEVLFKLEPVGKKLIDPFYSVIPQSRKPSKTATAEEITKYNMDKSEIFLSLLEGYPKDPFGLIGELQFAFICLLMGESYDAFEHWKELVKVITQSDQAIRKHPSFFVEFTSIFLEQLKEFPEDFFQTELSENNFLLHCLSQYFELLNDPTLPEQLQREGKKLHLFVQQKFGKNFFNSLESLNESTEDAPTIVEMNDSYF